MGSKREILELYSENCFVPCVINTILHVECENLKSYEAFRGTLFFIVNIVWLYISTFFPMLLERCLQKEQRKACSFAVATT